MEPALDIFLPVMESATVLAAHYAKACDRDVVLAEDMKFGLMYAARHVVGRQIGTLFPEIYDTESESDEDEEEDEDPEWARYAGGSDETALKMNECYDTWTEWVPETPAERALKTAVDKMGV